MPKGGSSELTAEYLSDLVKDRDSDSFTEIQDKLGGVEGIAKKLDTSAEQGLSKDGVEQHKQTWGENRLPETKPPSFISFLLDALKDKTLIILAVASAVSIALGVSLPPPGESRTTGWIEGTAILVAVMVVSLVTAINDYSKDRKFRQLSAVSEDRKCKVIRNGKQESISVYDVVVGDIVYLETGDYIPADMLYLEGQSLSADESPMTGEPEAVRKDEDDPFLLGGCMIMEGVGRGVVIAVGVQSQWGKIKATLEKPETKTPLQVKLEALAERIGKFGVAAAVVTLIALILEWSIRKFAIDKDPWEWNEVGVIVRFLITSITIIVVAVPEGLPLAVTLALAYSMMQMMKDQNLVRHLAACETMGGATNICSDKTGTLTQNKMTVVKLWLAQKMYDEIPEKSADINEDILKSFTEGISVNSSARIEKGEGGKVEFVGAKTEGALLVLAQKLGVDYDEVRKRVKVTKVYPFSSKKKRMSTVVPADNGMRLYVKGASEVLLARCTKVLDESGNANDLSEDQRQQLLNQIEDWAKQGFRTLSLAYKDLPQGTDLPEEKTDNKPTAKKHSRRSSKSIDKEKEEREKEQKPSSNDDKANSGSSKGKEKVRDSDGQQDRKKKEEKSSATNPNEDDGTLDRDLILIGLVGIEDPVRPEVPEAVRQCQQAGITVRMLTGDNILTAKNIAKQCNILTDDGVAIEGPKWRRMSDGEIEKILPKLQVIARCSPEDKLILVKRLRDAGQVVAVTGDGTNDAPQLREADVGFAMGISGTEVAKDASDIIIMDDNFRSIRNAVLHGRNVYDSIRKFVQFQMTVNVVAVVVAFVGAVTNGDSPLKAVQLLWVNLIMDTMAALALATEKPTEELLERPPYGRNSSLITPKMWRLILGQAAYQLAVLFFTLYGAHLIPFLNVPKSPLDSDLRTTIVFNTFVFCQVFNEINCRRLGDEKNVFRNLWKNWVFLGVFVITVTVQALLVQFGGTFAKTTPLNFYQWLYCLGVGLFTIPFAMVLRCIPVPEEKFGGRPEKGEEDSEKIPLLPRATLSLQELEEGRRASRGAEENWRAAGDVLTTVQVVSAFRRGSRGVKYSDSPKYKQSK